MPIARSVVGLLAEDVLPHVVATALVKYGLGWAGVGWAGVRGIGKRS